MEKLTDREKKILGTIAHLWDEQGYPPTLEEIGTVVGIGTRAGVLHHVRALERKGYLTRGRGRRSLKVLRGEEGLPVPAVEGIMCIPRYDRVRGGPLDLAKTEIEDYVSVPRDWLRGGPGFAVRVMGNSMFPNLMDGDLVIVQRRGVARTGEIVVALVGDDATIKRFRQLQDRVLLVPENPDYETLEFPGGAGLNILGKVVRSIRRFA